MAEIRRVINPHDDITIDYSDMDAARLAVLLVGSGAYGIEGNEGLPLLLFGAWRPWLKEKYNKSENELFDMVGIDRLATALESMALVGERSSTSDPVARGHELAKLIREQAKTNA